MKETEKQVATTHDHRRGVNFPEPLEDEKMHLVVAQSTPHPQPLCNPAHNYFNRRECILDTSD